MIKKILIWLFILSLTLFIGYQLNYDIGYRAGFGKAFQMNNKCEELVNAKKEETDFTVPECNSPATCPEFESYDVDGDDKLETIVLERIAMTQQAGRIWVIDGGKVVFKSPDYMQVGVSPWDSSPEKQTNGFIIGYNTETRMSPNFEESFHRDFYRYIDGKYTIVDSKNK